MMEINMSITSEWDNPQKTIIRSVFGETWTLDEYQDAIDQMYGVVPPLPATLAEYVMFRVPLGRVPLVIESGVNWTAKVVPPVLPDSEAEITELPAAPAVASPEELI